MRVNLAIMFKFTRQMADCPTLRRVYSLVLIKRRESEDNRRFYLETKESHLRDMY